ncbi:MAG: hypothetical protein HYX83_04415 [Chloroflexi bacterium]|nr:hypothetical protein [Chloroflexota bacterium]
MANIFGYTGRILRVDLSKENITVEQFDEPTARKYVGGTGLGIKYLYEEVPPGVEWSAPENRFILASGPLGGTRVGGSGTFSVVTKGALTNGATSSQANGFLGAYLRFSGFDGIIIQGAARRWVYLYIHDGTAELKEAEHLLGKDTWDTDEQIKKELGKNKREASVFSIGPAGENLVRFAGLFGDEGHAAAHNGAGAVLGSKKLKAIVAARSNGRVPLKDEAKLTALSKELFENIKTGPGFGVHQWGTSMLFSGMHTRGSLPVKNYTTSIFPQHERFMGNKVRDTFEIKLNPCWACQMHHCHIMTVTEGPYKGYVGEEPEYEGWASWGPMIGQNDPGAALMLANETDRLGMDTNEASWIMGWVLECYEKGLLTNADTDGLEMTWGNVEAVRAMLGKIAHRQGLGDVLAEGVMRAAQKTGGLAQNMAIYTLKGNTPRSHDHRGPMLTIMFDTCVSDIGTDQGSASRGPEETEQIPRSDPMTSQYLALVTAKGKPTRTLEDCLGTCAFNTGGRTSIMAEMVKAATGWDFSREEAVESGRRVINLLRSFNIRHGLTAEMERTSLRYGSVPIDGPVAGRVIQPLLEQTLRRYYEESGWDQETGKPLPATLESLGLEQASKDIWR